MNSYCFVDGGYLRGEAKRVGKPLVNPRSLAILIGFSNLVQQWTSPRAEDDLKSRAQSWSVGLARILYYDARPDSENETPPLIEEYWREIENLSDTDVAFGALRGRPKRQKKVDGLIAVDMLVGAFTALFQVAILIAGDSDFVPVVNEVRRRGVMVVVAGVDGSLSPELRRAADRVWIIDPNAQGYFPPLHKEGRVWFELPDGKVEMRFIA